MSPRKPYRPGDEHRGTSMTPAGLPKFSDRRGFVRTASGLLVAATTAQACKGVLNALGLGRVRVRIIGLAPGFTSAGSARILVPGSDPLVLDLTTDSGEAEVPPGSFPVLYTPPAGYGLPPGESNERIVTIQTDLITDAEFNVVPTTAMLRIVVTGVSTGAPAAGSATVTRTDIANQPPLLVEIPSSSASADISVLPGSYDVNYSPPAGYQMLTSPLFSLDVPADQISTATFEVERAGQASPVIAFHSDWSTALGSGDDAILDSGQDMPWDLVIGNGRLSTVVPALGLDFPSANVLLVIAGWRGSPVGAAAQNPRLDHRNERLPVPEIGESLFFRWYKRVIWTDAFTADTHLHPIQDGNSGSVTNWEQQVFSNSDGTWNPNWSVGGGGQNPFPINRWLAPRVNKHQTFRFEMQILRITDNTFNLHTKVYSAIGQLLYDNDDFTNINNTGLLSSEPALNFNDIAYLAGMQVGFNGISAGVETEFPMPLFYQGGVCVRTDDWCGPYAGGI